jgi:hypothetical protein
MIDAVDAVERLKQGGRLSHEELNSIKEQLSNDAPIDVYNLVRAWALAVPASPQNVALVARFFDQSQDEWDLKGVIYALCDYWNLTDRYLRELKELVQATKWPSYSNAAIAAFSALGAYVNETKDPATCRELLTILEDDLAMASCGDARFSFEHLAACYAALDRAVRGKQAIIERHKFKSVSGIRPDVLVRAGEIARLGTRP